MSISSPLIRPLNITFNESFVADLRKDLDRAIWPSEPQDASWDFGIPITFLKKLVAYWKDEFDWQQAESDLNATTHCHVTLSTDDGANVQVHVEVLNAEMLDKPPLLMTAGWPSSFLEYRHTKSLIASQVDRAIYIVDLPGFGLSSPPPRPLSPREIARMWRSMMTDVFGHKSFVAQGGDWGAVVTSWLGTDHADVTEGVHLTMLGLKPDLRASPPLSDKEKAWIKVMQKEAAADRGYREIQSSCPTTLAVGLVNSPVAVAAWLAEKYVRWSGGIDAACCPSMNDMLTQISIYWQSGNISSANWIYWADKHIESIALQDGEFCSVPTSFSFFEQGFFPLPPSEWTDRAYNVVHRNDHADGGHFAAWTKPDAFALDLLEFISIVDSQT